MAFPLQRENALDETGGLANVYYNGFRFPLTRQAEVSFSPEMSDDGRTVKYIRADIRIEFIWVSYTYTGSHAGYDPDETTDTTFPDLRQRLTNPGQPLRFVAQGIGDFKTQEDGFFDVNNGPKPRIVSEVPLGGSRALRVTWVCSTWFPNCIEQPGLEGIAQFIYNITWGIAYNGLTTRTVNGRAEIPLSRNPNSAINSNFTISPRANTTVRKTSDEVREDIVKMFPLLEGFERNQTYTMSEDRKTLNFTITDSEIPSDNPYFPGIVRMSARRRYASNWKNGFTIWDGMVSGSCEVAPGYSRLRAWAAFAGLFDDVFSNRGEGMISLADRPEVPQDDPGVTTVEAGKSRAFITSIAIDEDIYGREFNFSFGYKLFCSLATLFKATGLFRPLKGTFATKVRGITYPPKLRWDLWKTSMETIQGPRGWKDMKFLTSDDVIVDLCSPLLAPPVDTASEQPPLEEGRADGDYPYPIQPEDSYIHFDSTIRSSTDAGTSYSVPLQSSDVLKESADLNKPKSISGLNYALPTSSGGSLPAKPIVHRTRPGVYEFVFSGMALRVCYPIEVPNLVSIGGVPAIKIGKDQIVHKVVGKGTDVKTGRPLTIYGLSWRKRYVLEDLPQDGRINMDGHLGMYV